MDSNDNKEPPTDAAVWNNLKTWFQQTSGGEIHPALELRRGEMEYRGVFTTKDIAKGETLIRLPASLALDGHKMPDEYKMDGDKKSKDKRKASPWLRCLSAFYRYKASLQNEKSEQQLSASYFHSLPSEYECIWRWSDAEVENYLAGTSSPGGGEWNTDPKMVKERYQQQVRPYLEHLKIVLPECKEEEYQEFAHVCQTMSTRCFHVSSEKNDNTGGDDTTNQQESAAAAAAHANLLSDDYCGPFFLPAIDLINHSPNPEEICTTLQRSSGFFIMQAQRDIKAGQEILHSYGEHLTASQCLHTFGFVPTSVMEHEAAGGGETKSSVMTTAISPAVLTQQVVLDACYEVIRSDHPSRLAQSMQQQEMEDEVWNIPNDQKPRDASFLPEVVVIRQKEAFPNELITLACLPFLPVCAYREAARSLLDHSILDDYYLGKLVCAALLKALQRKLESYTPIKYKGSVVAKDDAAFLKDLLKESAPDVQCRRLMYALTVRLEEKESLQALRREIVNTLAYLDETADGTAEETTMRRDESPTREEALMKSPEESDLSKRQRME